MKAFFFSIFSVLSVAMAAQSAVTGTVTDAESGHPLPGAVVFLQELNEAAVSGSDGTFSLPLKGDATYNVVISYTGFQSTLTTVSAGAAPLDIKLPRGIGLQEVTISGAYINRQDESPQQIDVIKRSEMATNGASTVMDIITKVPGVNAITTGPLVSRPVIRGLSGNRILVANGGMRFETQQWDDEHGIGVNELGMDRVEIIKGPATLLFGPEAMGGVVNFIEEAPAAAGTIRGEVNGSAYSNNMGFYGRGDVRAANEKFNWSVSALGRGLPDYFYRGYDVRAPNTRLTEAGARIAGGIARKWGSTSLSYLFNTAFYGILDAKDIVIKPDGSILNTDTAEQEMFPGEVEVPYHMVLDHRVTSRTTLIAGKSQVKMLFGYQNNDRSEYEENKTKDGYLYTSMNLQSATYDVKWHLPSIAGFTTIIGAQGMYQENHNDTAAKTNRVPDAYISDAGGVILTKFYRSGFAFTAGGRYDYRNLVTFMSYYTGDFAMRKYYDNASAGVGVSYDIGKKLLVRANFATGYRPPNLNELTVQGYVLETQRYEFGNPTFRPERNEETDGGLTWRSKSLSVWVSAFHNYIRNYIYFMHTAIPIAGTGYGVYAQGDARITGGEAGISVHPQKMDWLRIDVTGSLLEAKNAADKTYLPMIPSDKLTTALTLTKKTYKRWKDLYFRAGTQTAFFQRKSARYEPETPDYTLVNLAFGGTTRIWKFTDVQFTVAANNLLDAVYFDNLSRLRYYGIANPGRNIVLSVKVPFQLK